MADPTSTVLARAAAVAVCRRDLEAFASELPAELDPVLDAALVGREAEAFTVLLLAAAHAGRLPSADEVLRRGAALLPDAGVLAAVVGHLDGDVPGALLGAVDDAKLGWDLDAVALLLVAYWVRRAGIEDPPGLFRRARSLARKAPGGLADVALVGLLGLTDDAALEDALRPVLDAGMRDDARDLAEGLAEHFVGPLLASVPETGGNRGGNARPIRRAVEKVGRNELCPCGSGKKYKRCHEAMDAQRHADASDVAGLTRAELRASQEAFLTPDRLDEMRAYELIRLDPARVPAELRGPWLDRLCFHREYSIMVEIYRVLDDAELDLLLTDHAADAAWNGALGAARELLALHHSQPDVRPWARIALTEALADKIALVEHAVFEHMDEGPIEAAYALLRSPWPALGVLAARALLPLIEPAEAEVLLGEVLDVREDLGLEPWDPIEDVLYQLAHGHDADTALALHSARDRLENNQLRLRNAQVQLAGLRASLAEREAAGEANEPVEMPVPQGPVEVGDDPERRLLRERIQALREELKDRHSERNALRRELRVTRERTVPVGEPPVSAEPESDDSSDDPSENAAESRLRLPVFTRDLQEALERVPDKVARAAAEKLCGLAVGREGAFAQTRRLRGRDWLWRAKVGRSYRLLFRLEEDRVEGLDLVHRQDFDKRIKQLGG